MTQTLANMIRQSVLDGDSEASVLAAEKGLREGLAPSWMLGVFVASIREVGSLWEEGECFLPELVGGAEAVVSALKVLKEKLANESELERSRKTPVAVIGTVRGDIHDIGKSLVGTMLMARGFDVIDLGVDVATEQFIDSVKSHKASLLGISALLTTTMLAQKDIIDALKTQGLRDQVKVLVGGAPVTSTWAKEIGADGTASDAMSAAELACRILENT